MNKLDKKLDRIIYLIDKLPDKEVVNIQEWQKAQIKATILQEIKKEMPKPNKITKESGNSMVDLQVHNQICGENRMLQVCLTTLEHLLGDK